MTPGYVTCSLPSTPTPYGADMLPQLGTILPDPASLRRADALADRQRAERDTLARREFPDWTPRYVGDELRHYRPDGRVYGIIARDGKPRYFTLDVNGRELAAGRVRP